MSWMVAPIIFDSISVNASTDNRDGLLYPKSPNMYNLRFNEHGGLSHTGNFTQMLNALSASSVGTVYSLYNYLSGANSFIMIDSYSGVTTNIYSGQEIVSNALSAISGFHPADTPIYYQTLNGKLLISSGDGNTQPVYWTGSGSFTALSGSIYGSYPEVHCDRYFLAKDSVNPSRVWWSGISTPQTFGIATDYIDINKNDGDKITGIKSFLGDLYIFKMWSVYKITGNDFDAVSGNYNVNKLEGVPGCKYHKSIVIAEGVMYWMSETGIVSYNGSTIRDVGRGMVNYIFGNYVGNIASDIVQGVYYPTKQEIWYIVSSSATVYIYSIPTGKWFTHKNYTGSAYTAIANYDPKDSTVSNSFLMLYDDTATRICRYPGSGLTNGQKVFYSTDYTDFGDPRRKSSGKLWISFVRGTSATPSFVLNVNVYYDNDASVAESFSTTPDNFKLFPIYLQKMNSVKSVKIEVYSNAGSEFSINKMYLEYELDTESGRV